MSARDALTELIADLGARMGIEALSLGSENACALEFDDRHVVGLRTGKFDDELWFVSDLGAPVSGAALYPALLRGNLLWGETEGATVSLTRDEPPHVVIALPVMWRGQDAGMLATTLDCFVDTVERWAAVIEADSSPIGAPAALPDPSLRA